MESPAPARKPNKALLIKLAGLAIAAAVAALAMLQGVDLRAWIDAGIAWVRGLGPVAFFGTMATLPAVGAPISPWALTAGTVFAPTLGWPRVLVFTWLALASSSFITYVISRWLGRPLLEKLVRRLGYDWPHVKPADYWSVAVLVRVAPGPPMVLQSALLGLARIPLHIYMTVSVVITGAYGTAFVIFGDALLHGRARMVVVAVMLFVALGVGTQLLRRRLVRRNAGTTGDA